MSRVTSIRAGCVVVVAGAALALAASPARAATLCVGPGPGCFATIQAAVNAAHDGDTITIAPGVYAGGITINVSVSIVGAGARATVVKGGSPVVLVGAPFPWSPKRPTVSITGVTITGGVNSSFPDAAVAQGGGLVITPSANPEPGPGLTGATVAIADSLITSNRVYATALIPPGFCGPRACAFADGAGIDNAGVLTLTNTHVSDNEAVSPPGVATSVGEGGIFDHPQGTLVVRRSAVTGNRVRGAAPNGREAAAGGIGGEGRFTIEDSIVSGNSVELSGPQPSEAVDGAYAGGILVGDGGDGTIINTIVRDNRVMATNPGGDMFAFGGGIVSFGSLTLRGSGVVHNTVNVTSSGGGAFDDGGGLEVDGPTTISDTVIAFNTVTATAPDHTAVAQGGGLANAGQTTMRRTLVIGNRTSATGADGVAQGGGVWNGIFGGPPPTLTVLDSAIVGNRASGSSGIAAQGGGLYTDFPVTIVRTLIAGNAPDQCFGC
jgi:hypothetical protein